MSRLMRIHPGGGGGSLLFSSSSASHLFHPSTSTPTPPPIHHQRILPHQPQRSLRNRPHIAGGDYIKDLDPNTTEITKLKGGWVAAGGGKRSTVPLPKRGPPLHAPNPFTPSPSSSIQQRPDYQPSLSELLEGEESLRSPDYFQVHQLFTVRDLFRARVHLGHRMGSLDHRMAPFLFGSRFDMAIFDLDKTAFHLRQALNFLAHVAYRKGIILFVARSPAAINLVESTAIQAGEYAHCRDWDIHTLTNSTRKYGGITRLPDTVVFLSTLNTVMGRHLGVTDSAKMLIPTVGVVDSNCDPNLITYPIPGNDDSLPALQLYCSLFKEAILRGKNKRRQVDEQLKQSTAEVAEVAAAAAGGGGGGGGSSG